MFERISIAVPNQSCTPAGAMVSPVNASMLPGIDKESLQRLPVQCKLVTGTADDPLEDEADAIANKVMRMPETNFIQRKCPQCEEKEKIQQKTLASFIQRKGSEAGSVASESISNQIHSTKGNGSNIYGNTRSFMENQFGTNFSNIKIHTDGEAIQMNRDLNAKAFTVGNDIYFNEGQYDPHSDSGKHLLAHELTHTIQQSGQQQIISKQDDDTAEDHSADQTGNCICNGSANGQREIHINLRTQGGKWNQSAVRVYSNFGGSYKTKIFSDVITGPATRGLMKRFGDCHLFAIQGHYAKPTGKGLIHFVNYHGGFGFHSNFWHQGKSRHHHIERIPNDHSHGCARMHDADENSTDIGDSMALYNLTQDGDCVRIYDDAGWFTPTFNRCDGKNNCHGPEVKPKPKPPHRGKRK